jgi:hypothetical protein
VRKTGAGETMSRAAAALFARMAPAAPAAIRTNPAAEAIRVTAGWFCDSGACRQPTLSLVPSVIHAAAWVTRAA